MSSAARKASSGRLALYGVNLFISFHYFFIIYINSAFIAEFVDTRTLSIVYLLGSVASIILFSFFAPMVKRLGNYRLTLALIALEIFALTGLAVAESANLVVISFLTFLAVSPVIYLNLDVFLEKLTLNERVTGGIRGLFLTMQNIAQVSCPVLVGLLLYNTEYWRVYLIAVACLLTAAAIVIARLRHFDDERYRARNPWRTLLFTLRHPALRNIAVAQALLRFFYAWMVIYTPLYLYQYIGFSWPEIGLMFSIMLAPFLLLELPLGKLADARANERGMVIIGLVLMIVSVAAIPFLVAPAFALWTTVLFMSRVGAACVEIASESYFFRRVDGTRADTIGLFRMARPATYILAAGAGAFSLSTLPLQWSFVVLAGILVLGLPFAFALRATKQ